MNFSIPLLEFLLVLSLELFEEVGGDRVDGGSFGGGAAGKEAVVVFHIGVPFRVYALIMKWLTS
jgi:hypothetical protein